LLLVHCDILGSSRSGGKMRPNRKRAIMPAPAKSVNQKAAPPSLSESGESRSIGPIGPDGARKLLPDYECAAIL
jgi:hypothetical protein